MIPTHILDELQKYRQGEHPYPFGGFVTAVLANDLVGAFAKADEHNKANMFYYADYLYNNLPRGMWGSYEIVAANIKAQVEAHRDKNQD